MGRMDRARNGEEYRGLSYLVLFCPAQRTWTLDPEQTYFPVSSLELSRTQANIPG